MTTATSPAAIDFNSFLPEGESLFDYQQVGVAYALVARRTFIADEMGLGKTRQALITLAVSNAFPAVIVCPASLKGNWENEVKRCLPGKSVQVLYGNRPYETYADVVIINYDILSDWAAYLDPQALILDESHYAKNPKAQRTVACQELADRVPASGLVLLLTGTPIMNRPVELLSQLRILGKLEAISPRPRKGNTDRDWEYAFKFTYCGPTQVQAGRQGTKWEFKGSSQTAMLNERLRANCMVRRMRADVLGMNDTVRIQVPMALNGKLDAYRAAERDFLSFIAKEGGPEAAMKASRALVITTMNKLRMMAGLAKTDAAVEWVKDFFEQNEGRSLVVFAWHKEVQDALVKAFPGCAQITQRTKATVEAEKAKFLAGETKLIVVSILMGQAGHTLVGPNIDCHDVVFFQQGWNPGTMQQAEDRINRIGQTAQYVFAHNTLAQGTIEEDIAAIIEEKRQVFNAVVNGTPLSDEEVEGSVQEAVLARMAGRG